ncbi:biotin--[acetyl-CoA-carboxylase] ligase [Tepidiphilus succinatimandens]|uniref:biotin--[acetyl-CoA-carboxylase] ligase n=1 Tax=Tepidiphilus succinatimandens TaxID=224436 RepID=UPI00112F4FDA|nr:biotin--[acetyl-CoA-carboxylase] ligase [Tepidiphilus succinatimandens]
MPAPSAFDPAALHRLLPEALARRLDLHWLGECASTNDEAMRLPLPDPGRLAVVGADRQTRGRGRQDRIWQSWPDASLTFSCLFAFPPGTSLEALPLAVGVALARGLQALGVPGVGLKWPNDLLIAGAKVAGVLIEAQSRHAAPTRVVVGIGLNLELPPDFHPASGLPATALAHHLAPLPPREAVLAALLERLDAVRASYLAGHGFAAWRDEWNALDAYAGQEVAVRDGERELVGIDAGVDDTGRLLLDTASGRIACCVGDVSLRPLA